MVVDETLACIMSTRSEKFRADDERRNSAPRVRKTKRKPKRDTASARAKREGVEGTGARNVMANESKVSVAYEDSATSSRPSRKSTRKSGGRKKASAVLEYRQEMNATRPQTKAQRRRKPGRHRKPATNKTAG